MSAPRPMSCRNCGHHWTTTEPRPESPIRCPQCTAHICGCGCGADLGDMRADAVYVNRAHYMALRRADGGACRPASTHAVRTRSVADVRAEQEAAKQHWSMVVREGILEVLQETGGYHADDLDHLGIPDEHRNIIGSQTAKLVNQKWIEEVGRRKSILPSRNGAKSGIYRLTPLGRNKLAGVGAGVPDPQGPGGAKTGAPCCTSADSGENSDAGVSTPQGSSGSSAPVLAPASESARLFDPAEAKARPLSPFTDAEAA